MTPITELITRVAAVSEPASDATLRAEVIRKAVDLSRHWPCSPSKPLNDWRIVAAADLFIAWARMCGPDGGPSGLNCSLDAWGTHYVDQADPDVMVDLVMEHLVRDWPGHVLMDIVTFARAHSIPLAAAVEARLAEMEQP